MRINNLNSLKPRRRDLRSSLTPAEAALWLHLRNRGLEGRKFRRQHSIGPYILDFFCPAEFLAVELDGSAHDTEAAFQRDTARDKYLASHGVRVVRFENRLVFENPEGVLIEIVRHFAALPGATPPRRLRRHPSS